MQVDENQALLHRNGEAYVMENTWTTSEQYPNDPFTSVVKEGSADILERVAAGTYIMEEYWDIYRYSHPMQQVHLHHTAAWMHHRHQ